MNLNELTRAEQLDRLFPIFRNIAGDDFLQWLRTGGFLTAPASTKYHGNYEGGLFDHSLAVMETLVKLTADNHLVWQREESPFVVGLFHDLCKCDQYKLVKDANQVVVNDVVLGDGAHELSLTGYHYEYNNKLLLKGHGTKSVILLAQHMRMTEEESLCIRYHMGAYEQDDWEGFDLAIRKYPNVLWTHTADMIASKVIGT